MNEKENVEGELVIVQEYLDRIEKNDRSPSMEATIPNSIMISEIDLTPKTEKKWEPAKRVRGDGLRRLQPVKYDSDFEFNNDYASPISKKKKKRTKKGKKGGNGRYHDESLFVYEEIYEEVYEEDDTKVEFVRIQDFTCRDVKLLIAPENVRTLEDDIENGRNDEYWSDDESNDYVLCSDMMKLANDNAICTNLIDAWATKLQKTAKEDGPKVLIFTAYLWGFLTRQFPKKIKETMLDKKLENFMDYDVLLFPTFVGENMKNKSLSTPNHFVLYVFDVKTKSWSFYNSVIEDANEWQDGYFLNSKCVLTAASNKIAKILSQIDPKLKWKLKVNWISDTPQQDPQTMDCGIIVCMLMERFLNGEDPLEIIEKKNCWEYRAKMINEFMVQHVKGKIYMK